MDTYIAKRDLMEVVSGLAQGVVGLKNLCANQSTCNTKLLDVQVESGLDQGILELKNLCSNHSTRNTKCIDGVCSRVDLLHDGVLKLVHCQKVGIFHIRSTYLGIYPSCLSSDDSDNDSDTNLETEDNITRKQKYHAYLLWKL